MRFIVAAALCCFAIIQESCNQPKNLDMNETTILPGKLDSTSTLSVKPLKVEKTHEGGVYINESLKKKTK